MLHVARVRGSNSAFFLESHSQLQTTLESQLPERGIVPTLYPPLRLSVVWMLQQVLIALPQEMNATGSAAFHQYSVQPETLFEPLLNSNFVPFKAF
eukprot:m.17575 g.17575  ORF g.17575 m.17575 type:complete len:96 (-) comp10676_c0_seq2:188-475(-)